MNVTVLPTDHQYICSTLRADVAGIFSANYGKPTGLDKKYYIFFLFFNLIIIFKKLK